MCQGFVTSVSQMRSFVPAIIDMTVALPKDTTPPTMLRLFKGQSSVVSLFHSFLYFAIFFFFFFCILWMNRQWIFCFVLFCVDSCESEASFNEGSARIRRSCCPMVQRYICCEGEFLFIYIYVHNLFFY